jgi:hypothetical protein
MASKKTKTVVTPGTKVSQATIDKIKSMGMSGALKSANSANPETREGIRRLYGARRYNKAIGTSKPAAPKPTDSRFSGVKKPSDTKPTDSRFSGIKPTTPALKMPGKGPAVKVIEPNKNPVFSGTAAQKEEAASRAGGNVNMNRTTAATKQTPRKPYVAPKATAAQMAQAKARAGGNVNLTPKPKAPETLAQKRAKAALVKKQRQAAANAVKRGGGRTA